MTVEEFLEWQQRQDKNYELVTLGNRLRGQPCQPRTSNQSVLTFRVTRIRTY